VTGAPTIAEDKMKKYAIWLTAAALVLAVLAMPATSFAKRLRCGGPELSCPGKLVKVCNPKNDRCCCATAGTYR
jgi:hypothetical protein